MVPAGRSHFASTWIFALSMVCCSTATVLGQTPTVPLASHGSTQSSSGATILIAPGDVLSVSLFDKPELSREVRVSGDGKVSLPLIMDVSVLNLDEVGAARRIDQAYLQGGFVLHPQTSVLIHEFATKGVSLFGEVTHPGIYPLPGPRTLIDVLALAGGLTSFADSRLVIQRSAGTADETIILPRENASADLTNDINIYPGDRVVAQRAGMVYVLGDVGRPGGYVMQHGGTITVLQAIAEANGTSHIAGEDAAVLIHQNGAAFTMVPVALRKMYKGKQPDMPMQSNDVLYVPSSNVRNFVFNAPQILASIGGAAIYSAGR